MSVLSGPRLVHGVPLLQGAFTLGGRTLRRVLLRSELVAYLLRDPSRDLFPRKRGTVIEPSEDLYRQVRAIFVKHDSSLNEWCRAHKIPLVTARAALTGFNKSPRARQICAKLCYVTGLSDSETP